MDLSIVIVNHNVSYFVEQCLQSVRRASQGIASEVVVVDNDSRDVGREYLTGRFRDVRFLWNEVNVGFAKANNQGLKATSGKYVLFLNPDTLLSEGCLGECIRHLEENPGTGAVGIRMVDGSGRFLKESRRGFPTPAAALFKLFGLSSLFPSSRVFSRYHMGHLDPLSSHPTDVLSGAYMMVRREVLERIGGFDEQFFMYGEDIDLSFRIQKAGFVNQYLAGPPIVHFKGESTEKGNLGYVRMFYSAMAIFARKHYGRRKAGLLSSMLYAGIWLRAMVSVGGLVYRRHAAPLFPIVNLKRSKSLDSAGSQALILVAGSKTSAERVRAILSRNGVQPRSVARVNLDERDMAGLDEVEGIGNVVERMQASELVVCPDSLSYGQIVSLLAKVPRKTTVSISANGTGSIVGAGIRRG